ncbi:glycoside hydrolase family 17 protein [Aulographum hederae CBS 113979]|uniref:Glycoside hydrolase family 17 protein n=1 Tax=Aulographum hederae CBS 113979 TaxID=1176131 RepID=A0A6G1H315_9PEZI|nr:glycoside hydrolase family 17 protein [Aulographum hederae CBS 113979]
MKAGFFNIVAFSLISLAAAQPHGHKHHHEKRDVVTVTNYVTAQQPEAVIYYDHKGNVAFTSYLNGPGPTAAPTAPQAPVPSAPTPVAEPATTPTPDPSEGHIAPSPPAAPVIPPPPAPPPADKDGNIPKPVPTGDSNGFISWPKPKPHPQPPVSNKGLGISYSAYVNRGHIIGDCKTKDEVREDIEKLSSYAFVRVYGTDCDQLSKVLAATRPLGMKVFAGVYDLKSVSEETQELIDAVNAAEGGWDNIDTVSIGNEDINRGAATVSAVISATNSARGQLRAAGWTGPIVHVETFNQYLANPEICAISDYAAANCHAFFDPTVRAEFAGEYVWGQALRVALACGGKPVTITESGWPWNGETDGLAVPSRENQEKAVASLKRVFKSNLVLFSAFNDPWKVDQPGTFNAEKYWGFLGDGAS